jgi:hypothetical protein
MIINKIGKGRQGKKWKKRKKQLGSEKCVDFSPLLRPKARQKTLLSACEIRLLTEPYVTIVGNTYFCRLDTLFSHPENGPLKIIEIRTTLPIR